MYIMQNIQNRNKGLVFSGVTLFVIGILLLSSNYLNAKVDNAYSYMNNMLLESNEEEVYEIQEEVEDIVDATSSFVELPETEEEYVDPYLKYYIGTLSIPKINLNKGFTAIDSEYNTVNKNVEVVKGSTYPDMGGNLILAAHSGTSYLAYFKNLYQLENGDIAYIEYKNKRYTYKIVNIYEQDKTGKIAIYRDTSKTG